MYCTPLSLPDGLNLLPRQESSSSICLPVILRAEIDSSKYQEIGLLIRLSNHAVLLSLSYGTFDISTYWDGEELMSAQKI